MENLNNQTLLSICIPTWNRSVYLGQSLASLQEQLKDIPTGMVELYVSDNCSGDETPTVVDNYIQKGLPLTYNRNSENIGAARNFLQCMKNAKGKYILLLGDDDILNLGALSLIIEKIKEDDYGLIYFHRFDNIKDPIVVYDNKETFYKQISYWFTFMSSSIFRKDVVDQIDFNKYVGTHLLQMPYYIASADRGKRNLIINQDLLNIGLDWKNNGGYNFYEVFVQNYLNIWKDYMKKGTLSQKCYKYLKKDVLVNYIHHYNYRILIKHEGVKNNDVNCENYRKGYVIKGYKKILLKYYGGCWYFYWSIIRLFLRKILTILKNKS